MCCFKTVSPLSCVLFPTSAVAGVVLGLFSRDGGIPGGFCRVGCRGWVVLGGVSWHGGVFSEVLGRAGVVLGVFSLDRGVTGDFSRVWVRAGGFSWVDGAFSKAGPGLRAGGADGSL